MATLEERNFVGGRVWQAEEGVNTLNAVRAGQGMPPISRSDYLQRNESKLGLSEENKRLFLVRDTPPISASEAVTKLPSNSDKGDSSTESIPQEPVSVPLSGQANPVSANPVQAKTLGTFGQTNPAATGGWAPPASTQQQLRNIANKVRRDRLALGFTFEYVHGNTRKNITLFINPEEFSMQEPARINVTQTKGGAFVDYFGPGLNTITMRGVTGYRNRDVGGTSQSGQDHFLEFRKMVRDWTTTVQIDPLNTEMRFYNWADQEYYKVVITQFNLMRSVSRPLLYQYNLAMTVIQDLTVKVKEATEKNDVSQYLINPQKRAGLSKQAIEKTLWQTEGIIDQTVDMSKLSPGTQAWSTFIAKGGEYLNKANNLFEPVQNVVSSVKQFSSDLSMYISGVSSFIQTPFNLTRDLANSIGDVISTMSSVTEIPHELIRSFREMSCAIKALPETLFKGFTNPSLFEGASNCGTTLGIPEAPVAAYDNSFTATAQLPTQREVSQIFNAPALTLLLQEPPVTVTGVFLATDTGRSGLNYLEKITEKQVTLTSVPAGPVVVDYSVPQISTTDMVKLQAAGVWTVSTDETIESIALRVYNDASEWKKITLFNNMEYPFIVADDFVKERSAVGVVRFYRRTTTPAYTGAYVIPIGTPVYVLAYFGTYRIDFRTSEAKVLEIGMSFVDVPVVATKAGPVGNVAPRLISSLDGVNTPSQQLTPHPYIESIANILPTGGGKIWKVKYPGEIIFIPREESAAAFSVVLGVEAKYEQLFGIDILLNNDGELEASTEGSADLKRVAGSKNLVQALNDRLKTSKGFYPYHAEYGSNRSLYIGQKNDPKRQDLIRVDVKETCLLDPRIDNLQAFHMVVDGDTVGIEFDAIPIEDNTPLKVNLIV